MLSFLFPPIAIGKLYRLASLHVLIDEVDRKAHHHIPSWCSEITRIVHPRLQGVPAGPRPLIIQKGSDSKPSSLHFIPSRETRVLQQSHYKRRITQSTHCSASPKFEFPARPPKRTRFTPELHYNQRARCRLPLQPRCVVIALATATSLDCRLRKTDGARENKGASPSRELAAAA